MPAQYFDRRAELRVIGQIISRDPLGRLMVQNSNNQATAFPSTQEDGSPGYRIQFTVDANTGGPPNPSEISIYNLGPTSRSLFQTLNSRIELRVGYGDEDLQLIFTGNIQRTRTEKVGPDYVTKINAADGLIAWQNTTVNQSFGPGTTLINAANSLGDLLNLSGLSTDFGGLPSKTYQSGIVLSGNAIQQLEKLITSENIEFSIQQETVITLPAGTIRGNISDAFVLSVDTGMIGIPQVGDNSMTVTSLLNPRLRPYSPVVIRSIFVNGIYRINKVVHKGDTFEGEFVTEMETDIARNDLGFPGVRDEQ